MNSHIFAARYATATGLNRREAEYLLGSFFQVIRDALMFGDEISIPQVGKLFLQYKPERVFRNRCAFLRNAKSQVVVFKPGNRVRFTQYKQGRAFNINEEWAMPSRVVGVSKRRGSEFLREKLKGILAAKKGGYDVKRPESVAW